MTPIQKIGLFEYELSDIGWHNFNVVFLNLLQSIRFT